jgi:hypothetical protein
MTPKSAAAPERNDQNVGLDLLVFTFLGRAFGADT